MFSSNPLNESSHSFPVLEAFHLVGMICGVGTAALMNLSLISSDILPRSPSKLWRATWLVTLAGVTLAIGSGLMLFSIDPELYFNNTVFRIKLLVLVLALTFYYTLVRRAAARDQRAVIVASISLILYALVPLAGIFIGYK